MTTATSIGQIAAFLKSRRALDGYTRHHTKAGPGRMPYSRKGRRALSKLDALAAVQDVAEDAPIDTAMACEGDLDALEDAERRLDAAMEAETV